VVTLAVNFVALWTLALIIVPWHAFQFSLFWIFILDGVLTQALGRLLKFVSIDRMGAARAGAILGATPMFSIGLAVLIRGERLTYLIFLGAMLIVVGLVLLSGGGGGGRVSLKALLFPLAAAFLFGLSPNLRKFGLQILPYPMLAAAVTSTTSLFTLLVSSRLVERGRFAITKRSLVYFLLSGLCTAVVLPVYYYSLSLGDVVVLGPLANTGGFFSVVIARLWMGKEENITGRVWAGAVAVIAGATAIFLH
jgi:uncharacterized membrane protein